jgi:hypothetical protein
MHLGRIAARGQEVCDLLVVQLQVGALDAELAGTQAVEVVEDLRDRAWHDARVLGRRAFAVTANVARHRVRLARASLACAAAAGRGSREAAVRAAAGSWRCRWHGNARQANRNFR